MNRRRVLFSVGLLLTSVLCGVLARFAAGLAEVEWARLLTVAALLLAAFSVALVVPRFLRGNKPGLPRARRALQLTARGIVFLLVVLLLGVSTIDSGNNLLILVLSTLVAALLVSGFGSNLGLQNLHVSLQLPSRIHAGQKAVFLLTLRNLKRWVPSFGIRLRNRRCEEVGEEATDFFGQEQHFPYLAAGGSLELQMETIFGERGAYSLEGFEVTTSFPFGFLVAPASPRSSGHDCRLPTPARDGKPAPPSPVAARDHRQVQARTGARGVHDSGLSQWRPQPVRALEGNCQDRAIDGQGVSG